MSELRRRIFGSVGTADTDSTPSSSRDVSPAPGHKEQNGEQYKVVPRRKLERMRSDVKEMRKKGTKRRAAWIFVLGGLFGIFVAGFFASNNGSLEKWVQFAGIKDMNLDSLLDVLPAGMIKDVHDLQVSPLKVCLSFAS
jgi:phospholipid:diacylglycerol acyltransferase